MLLKLELRRFWNTSAMATSWVGPLRADRALTAAPVPRPPQPTRAMRIVLFSAACTFGTLMPANADTAATVPDFFMTSRRDMPFFLDSLTIHLLFPGRGSSPC